MRAPEGSGRPALDRVRIEPLRGRHLRQVLAIERRVYPRPWSPELFAQELDRTDRRYLVARAASRKGGRRRVVGYAGLLLQVDEAHVTTVAVDPDEHRRKVATRLMLGLLEAARAADVQSATLEVRAANHGAQRLYTAFGFAPAGVRPGYYRETGEDAVVMWAHELQGADMAARLAAQRARLDAPGGASGAPDHLVPWVRDRVGLPGPDAVWGRPFAGARPPAQRGVAQPDDTRVDGSSARGSDPRQRGTLPENGSR